MDGWCWMATGRKQDKLSLLPLEGHSFWEYRALRAAARDFLASRTQDHECGSNSTHTVVNAFQESCETQHSLIRSYYRGAKLNSFPRQARRGRQWPRTSQTAQQINLVSFKLCLATKKPGSAFPRQIEYSKASSFLMGWILWISHPSQFFSISV